jgi:hypothetical protein
MMKPAERRATARFLLNLPMTVRWTTGSGIAEAETESRDISSRGLYFFLPKEVPNGSPVEIVLTLPHEITLHGRTRVFCQGCIQRTETTKVHCFGVVARIERYEFLPGLSVVRRHEKRLRAHPTPEASAGLFLPAVTAKQPGMPYEVSSELAILRRRFRNSSRSTISEN